MLKKEQIEQYIKELRVSNIKFDSQLGDEVFKNTKEVNPVLQKIKVLVFIILSFIDFIILKSALLFPKFRNKKIVYTTPRFTTITNDVVEDRILKPLFTDNILFINHSLENRIWRINGQKVYNIGGLVKVLSFFQKESTLIMRNFYAYQKVNKWLLNRLSGKEIYFILYYDLNSLSIILSDYRNRLKLIEVQHGSMINYFPYLKKAPLKIIDVFYVKNQATIDFLKENVCKGFDCEYKLLPYPKSKGKHTQGVHVLYASTVEFEGVHPVFLDYLKTTNKDNLNIYIRLHPREKHKKKHFESQLKGVNANISFDESKNWLASNQIKNLIVVSPWSSVIEDAADNGYKTIILEEFGKERFGYLIDEENVIFAADNYEFIKKINLLIEQDKL
ncbi:MAG TPA: hypothetical protein VLZ11_09185 [Flavobacterium sp.]|nr:hypothetical protein [Flavobacterium sp.]